MSGPRRISTTFTASIRSIADRSSGGACSVVTRVLLPSRSTAKSRISASCADASCSTHTANEASMRPSAAVASRTLADRFRPVSTSPTLTLPCAPIWMRSASAKLAAAASSGSPGSTSTRAGGAAIAEPAQSRATTAITKRRTDLARLSRTRRNRASLYIPSARTARGGAASIGHCTRGSRRPTGGAADSRRPPSGLAVVGAVGDHTLSGRDCRFRAARSGQRDSLARGRCSRRCN